MIPIPISQTLHHLYLASILQTIEVDFRPPYPNGCQVMRYQVEKVLANPNGPNTSIGHRSHFKILKLQNSQGTPKF